MTVTMNYMCQLSHSFVCMFQVEKKPVNPHEEQEIIDGIEAEYYNNESFDTSLFQLQVSYYCLWEW